MAQIGGESTLPAKVRTAMKRVISSAGRWRVLRKLESLADLGVTALLDPFSRRDRIIATIPAII